MVKFITIIPNRGKKKLTKLQLESFRINHLLLNKEENKKYVVYGKRINKNGGVTIAILDEINCEVCGTSTRAEKIPGKWFPQNIGSATIRGTGEKFNVVKCPSCGKYCSLSDKYEMIKEITDTNGKIDKEIEGE